MHASRLLPETPSSIPDPPALNAPHILPTVLFPSRQSDPLLVPCLCLFYIFYYVYQQLCRKEDSDVAVVVEIISMPQNWDMCAMLV